MVSIKQININTLNTTLYKRLRNMFDLVILFCLTNNTYVQWNSVFVMFSKYAQVKNFHCSHCLNFTDYFFQPKRSFMIARKKEIYGIKWVSIASLSLIVRMNDPNPTFHSADK